MTPLAAEQAAAPAAGSGSVLVAAKLIEGPVPSQDPDSPLWNQVPTATFPLSAQVHWDPRIFNVTVKSLQVRALHNGKEVAFRFEYQDPKEDEGDAAALEFPVGEKKAHFAHAQPLMQMEGGEVNIWHWKNSAQKSGASPVADLWAKGFGTLTPHQKQDVTGKGVWRDGQWRIVFSRSLHTDDPKDTQFSPGPYYHTAFAVWDGANREQGAMKAVTSWYYFRADAPPDLLLYVYTGLAVVLTGMFEWLLVRRIRRTGGER